MESVTLCNSTGNPISSAPFYLIPAIGDLVPVNGQWVKVMARQIEPADENGFGGNVFIWLNL